MSQIRVPALLALSALALSTSTTVAQTFQRLQGGADRTTQGSVSEDRDVPMCQAAPGGSRVRPNCEFETETLVAARELKPLLIEIPALENRECGAVTATEYLQLNTIARVTSTLRIEACTVASGDFTVELLVTDDSGEDRPLEFDETWQRSDAQDVTFAADYPIGENVELRSVRIRRLSCTCADPPSTSTPSDGSAQSPATAGSPQ